LVLILSLSLCSSTSIQRKKLHPAAIYIDKHGSTVIGRRRHLFKEKPLLASSTGNIKEEKEKNPFCDVCKKSNSLAVG
jgi:hypothetical protein